MQCAWVGERQSMCNVEAWVRLNLKDLILESRISAVTVLVAVVVVRDCTTIWISTQRVVYVSNLKKHL